MFTGIIELTGQIESMLPSNGGWRLRLRPSQSADWSMGESISVNGACLTLAAMTSEQLEFDLTEETLKKTTLGALKAGDMVNLERSLKLGDRLGGHFVSGHVDGVGQIKAIRRSGANAEFDFRVAPDLMAMIAQKGSVAVEGVSLTPFAPTQDGFTVSVIPTTLALTTLGRRASGDSVNIEIDLLARYVKQIMDAR